MFTEMMACGRGGTIKDSFRNKVLDGGLTNIATLTVYNSRISISESGVVADKTNHTVYVYVDFTANGNYGQSSDWAGLAEITSVSGENISNYIPRGTQGGHTSNICLITDESSDNPTNLFIFGDISTQYPHRFFIPYGVYITTGQHYIVYGAYTY